MSIAATLSRLAAPGAASFYGRYTHALHLRAAALDAVASGALLLNEFVARKALGASDAALTVLLMLPSVAQLVNLYWSGTGARNPRAIFLWVGLPSRLALLGVAFVSGSASFILLATLASTATTIVVPAQNAIYQANYAARERGRLFARVTAVAAAVTVAVTSALGALYDRDESLFRLAYPVCGLVAAAGSLSWYRIRWRRRELPGGLVAAAPAALAAVPRPGVPPVLARAARGLLDPFRQTAALFREDRDFLRFESAFMCYGVAYMMLQPVLPVFLVDELRVDYSQASRAKGLLFYGVMILLLPLAGRANDRLGSLRVASASFLLLAAFPALLAAARGMGVVYVAYALFGAAMAGVNVAWTLGPLDLARGRSAERYMGAHVSLVGVRGLVSYPAGLLLMRLLSPRATFAVSAGLALVAAAVMGRLASRRAGSPAQRGYGG